MLWGANLRYPVRNSLVLVPCEFIPPNPIQLLEDLF